jgi:hypothetical protein
MIGSTMMRISFLALAVAALLTAGCSSSDVKLVKGKVTYNGDPLEGAELEFLPKEDRTIGSFIGGTKPDGSFEIKLGKGTGKYAKAGSFVALVTKGKSITTVAPDNMMTDEERLKVQMKMQQSMVAGGQSGGAGGGGTGILPDKYGSRASTPFKFEITEGDNDIGTLELKGPPLKK